MSIVQSFYSRIEKHSYLCKGCGACEGVCSEDAVKMRLNEIGEWLPDFNSEKCKDCGLCVEVCPGNKITPLSDCSPIGKHIRIYSAKSLDPNVKNMGSSGGVLTALSTFALKINFVNEFLTFTNDKSGVFTRPILKTRECKPCKTGGSFYVLEPNAKYLKMLTGNSSASFLPCQCSAVRNSGKPLFIFGLFCSRACTALLPQWFAFRCGVKAGDIKEVSYRDGKWPGSVKITHKSGEINLPYLRSFYTAAFNSGFFTPQGCYLCNDYFNDKADISLGDPWHNNSSEGESIVVIRSERALKLFSRAVDENIIQAQEIEMDEMVQGHLYGIFQKRASLSDRLNYLAGKMGDDVPVYKSREKEKIKVLFINLLLERWSFTNSFFRTSERKIEKMQRKSALFMFVKRYIIMSISLFIYRSCLKKWISRRDYQAV